MVVGNHSDSMANMLRFAIIFDALTNDVFQFYMTDGIAVAPKI